MTSAEELSKEIEAVRRSIGALNAAMLRVSATLDIATVLNEIAVAARRLTGAQYAVITTTDHARQVEDYVMSGLSPEEERQLNEWPERWQVLERLRDLPSPLRVADMPAYLRAAGFTPEPVFIHSFQGARLRHRDVQVGDFFLGETERGIEFTDEDEEVLVLFASQAATAIANARTHRAEQRAR